MEEVESAGERQEEDRDHLTAIRILKEKDVKGSGIIGAYHMRRVAPLMTCALPLHMMVPGVALDGTTLAEGALSPSEVAQRIKEAMEPSWDNASATLDFCIWCQGIPQCG